MTQKDAQKACDELFPGAKALRNPLSGYCEITGQDGVIAFGTGWREAVRAAFKVEVRKK